MKESFLTVISFYLDRHRVHFPYRVPYLKFYRQISPPNKTQMVNQNGKSVIVRMPTEPQPEPNEASPLNQRGRDNNSDVSSASAVTSEQSTKKLIDAEMIHSKRRLLRIGIDLLLLCCGEFC